MNTGPAHYSDPHCIDPIFSQVLNVLGELTPENRHHRDYAKWKAAYIHNCLKNGETPVAGPLEGAPERDDEEGESQAVGGDIGLPQVCLVHLGKANTLESLNRTSCLIFRSL